MPGRYGSPFRVNSFKENNKVIISIINIDENGKLNNTSTSLLKSNIAEYLSNYRMVNDYVEIRDGRIFNLGVDVYVYVKDGVDNKIINNIINVVSEFFNVKNRDMNEDVMLTSLSNIIMNIEGVNNIIDLKILNKVGNGYSINPIRTRNR